MDSTQDHKKSNKKRLIIGGSIITVVLVLVLGFYWRDQQRTEQARQSAQSFVEALEKQDYEQLASLVSPTSLAEINYTPEEVQERYRTIYGGIGASELSAENIQISEDAEPDGFAFQYDLQMTTSLGELDLQSYQTTLEEIEEGFAVDWDPSLIFPEMEAGDTVQIALDSGERGNLLDRNGELLAGKVPAFEAGLHPLHLGEGEERAENLEAVAAEFETSAEDLEVLLEADWVTEESFVPFAVVDEEERPEMTGVEYRETTMRDYPLGEAGAHLIGYTGEAFAEDLEEDATLQAGDVIGKSGLEATFEERLRGSRGGTLSVLSEEGETKNVLQEAPAEDGEDITLTIDRTMQEDYYNTFNGERGAAVVTEPATGELLVLTSSPSYNPTEMSRGISEQAYQEYANDGATPFLPRYTARYAPGSTFKALTGAIGLDSGATTVDEIHNINGYEWRKDESWGAYVVTRVQDQPTEVSLEDALVYSDNIFFAQEALEMGADTFMTGLDNFPFGETFELPLSMNPAQVTNSGTFDSEILLAETAFGQGQLLMSPLHQAVFFSPFATGGDLVYPKLEQNEEPSKVTQPVTAESAQIVKDYLIEVVEDPDGTAHALSNSSKPLAAKTGTTEIHSQEEEGSMDTNGFLLAFDPEEQSFLSIIMVEDAGGDDVVDLFLSVFD